MTYAQAIEYIHSVSWLGSRPGLERIKEFCYLMGNIQDKLNFVHVAGTNGKGSVCSMLASVLAESGLKVGVFTSPYVYRFNERMAINGEPISDEDLANIIDEIKPLADQMTDTPTEFELITAAGFLYFYEQKCDIVVLEAGMGGRLDSTNIIKTSRLSIITGIALDHTAYLGDREELIAVEKAGIIKPGVPVVCGRMSDMAFEVIQQRANALGSEIVRCDYTGLDNVKLSLKGNSFSYCGDDYDIKLTGEYQTRNAVIVITAARLLGMSAEHIKKGIGKARWRARFEVLHDNPPVIYDGGHNPEGVAAAVETVNRLFESKINILTGVMKDKDHKLIAGLISPIADKVFCVTPDNPRSLPAKEYVEDYREAGIDAFACDKMSTAVKTAYGFSKQKNTPLLVLGSLYMYGEFVDEFERNINKIR